MDYRKPLIVLASAGLLAACGQDETQATDPPPATETTPRTDAAERDRRSQAVEASVAYFEALFTHRFDDARGAAGGSAELVVDWDEALTSSPGAQASPHRIDATPAPDIQVSIGDLIAEDDRWRATGYLGLSEIPPGHDAQPGNAEAPEGTVVVEPAASAVYVTDLVFADESGRTVLVDFRYDDVYYPVSELYTSTWIEDSPNEAPGATGTVVGDAVEAEATLARRSQADGSVQYIVRHPSDATLTQATLRTATDDEDVPPTDLEVYGEAGTEPTLLVWPGGFPGNDGIIEATFEPEGEDRPSIAIVRTPSFEPLGSPRPLGEARGRAAIEFPADQPGDGDDPLTTSTPPMAPPTTTPTTAWTIDTTTTTVNAPPPGPSPTTSSTTTSAPSPAPPTTE